MRFGSLRTVPEIQRFYQSLWEMLTFETTLVNTKEVVECQEIWIVLNATRLAENVVGKVPIEKHMLMVWITAGVSVGTLVKEREVMGSGTNVIVMFTSSPDVSWSSGWKRKMCMYEGIVKPSGVGA